MDFIKIVNRSWVELDNIFVDLDAILNWKHRVQIDLSTQTWVENGSFLYQPGWRGLWIVQPLFWSLNPKYRQKDKKCTMRGGFINKDIKL